MTINGKQTHHHTLISVWLWNFKDGGSKKARFWPKISIFKENHSILRIWGVPVGQILGMILENKVVQKLKLEKMFLQKMVA